MKPFKFIALILSAVLLNSHVQAQHFEVSTNEGCSPVEVELTNLHPSSGYTPNPVQTTGFTYNWDFGGGQTSTEENPDPVVFTNPGPHEINYDVTIDTIGFKIFKIHISEIACDDPDIWPLTNDPDIYIEIVDGSSNVILSTYDDADDHTTDPDDCNIIYSFSEIPMDNPPYFVRVRDKDSGDSDDNCIDGEESENAGTLINFPANNATGFGETEITYTNGGLEFTVYYNKIVFQFSGSETVQVNPTPATPALSETNISACFGSVIPTVSATGSNIEWYADEDLTDMVQTGNGLNFDPDSVGIYTFYVVQTETVNGCKSEPAILTINAGELAPPSLPADSLIYCYGQILPEIIAEGEIVNWYDNEALSNLIHTGDSLNPGTLEVGEYDYYAVQEDESGNCQSQAAQIHVSVINTIEANYSTTDASCFGVADGSASITVTDGEGPFTINWSNGSEGNNLTNVISGEYIATIMDKNFCLKNILVDVPGPTEMEYNENITNISCYGEDNGSISLNLSGSVPPYSYLWEDESTGSDLSMLAPGTYNITVTDDQSCTSTKSFEITQPDSITVTSTTINEDCAGAYNGEIHLNVNGGIEPYRFSWPEGMHDSVATELTRGEYKITIQDDNNCALQETVNLKSDYDICIVPASVLTPNGDGKNDTWKIKFIEMYASVKVSVFDRSGKLLYEQDGYSNQWDGTVNGNKLPIGSYYYIIDLKDGSEAIKGFVDIIY